LHCMLAKEIPHAGSGDIYLRNRSSPMATISLRLGETVVFKADDTDVGTAVVIAAVVKVVREQFGPK